MCLVVFDVCVWGYLPIKNNPQYFLSGVFLTIRKRRREKFRIIVGSSISRNLQRASSDLGPWSSRWTSQMSFAVLVSSSCRACTIGKERLRFLALQFWTFPVALRRSLRLAASAASCRGSIERSATTTRRSSLQQSSSHRATTQTCQRFRRGTVSLWHQRRLCAARLPIDRKSYSACTTPRSLARSSQPQQGLR